MIAYFSILAQYAHYYTTDSAYSSSSAAGAMGYSPVTLIGILILIISGIIGFAIRNGLQSSVQRNSAIPAPLTGADTARLMLQQHGIHDVQVISTPGQLTDHYNPIDRTINLSEDVFNCASVTAMAVAAHECGHAVQHARAYPWLGLRSSLVPMVNLGSRLGSLILMVGMGLVFAGGGTTIAWIGLILFASTTLFALITLPVEFDASRRALAWLQQSGLANRELHANAGNALHWAAMTYVAAALSSLAMLIYYALILLGSGRRD